MRQLRVALSSRLQFDIAIVSIYQAISFLGSAKIGSIGIIVDCTQLG